jgi:hypothetical protein
MIERFSPKVHMPKLTNKKGNCEGQNIMEHSFNIITKWINIQTLNTNENKYIKD